MTEGPGQQPPQEPRDGASDGGREVLEGLVIPSRRQPRHATHHDPRRDYAAPQDASGGEQPDAAAPGAGPAWSPESAAATGQGGQQPPASDPPRTAKGLPTRQPSGNPPQIAQAARPAPGGQDAWGAGAPQAQAPGTPGPTGPQSPLGQRPPGTPGAQDAWGAGAPQAQAPSTPGSRPHPGPTGPQPPLGQRPPGTPGAQDAWGAGAPQAQAPSTPGPTGPQPPLGQRAPGGRGSRGRTAGRAGRGAEGAEAAGIAFRREPDGGGTPDWGALAAEQEASGRRRRKVMMLTGAIVAVAVIAGGVATAVVLSGKSSSDTAIDKPSSSTGGSATQASLPPQPSFSSVAPPPPANPVDYIGTAAKDKAPLTPGSLFPGKQFLMDGRVYVKTAAAGTTSCASGARSAVAQALAANGCRKLIRTTYTSGGVAVTVGVAVFDDTAHATKLKTVAQYLAPLNGGGVHDFCHAVACRMTSNSIGRYAYFAIAGLKDGKTITASDKVALLGANDASNFAFQRIIQRGRDAAAADPSRR
ncbi:hypothetical protein V2S66_07535 [Streptomyces sp. V4-01]|uniref:Uncharacterized protein n=1 Tax=Actinacidiphila polyblastidii TaxID=3110430 RepID=A0ABU7P9Q0_9ACTN|nr:hypothetical protein [Streptomyces sp. V4-01]